MQEQQGAVEMMRCQLNYRQSVQKGGELVHLRIQPRRTVETNKLFWPLRIKTCLVEKAGNRVMGQEGEEYQVRSHFGASTSKVVGDSWHGGCARILVCSSPGLPDGIWLLPLPSAVRREKLLLRSEPLAHLSNLGSSGLYLHQGLTNNKMPLKAKKNFFLKTLRRLQTPLQSSHSVKVHGLPILSKPLLINTFSLPCGKQNNLQLSQAAYA